MNYCVQHMFFSVRDRKRKYWICFSVCTVLMIYVCNYLITARFNEIIHNWEVAEITARFNVIILTLYYYKLNLPLHCIIFYFIQSTIFRNESWMSVRLSSIFSYVFHPSFRTSVHPSCCPFVHAIRPSLPILNFYVTCIFSLFIQRDNERHAETSQPAKETSYMTQTRRWTSERQVTCVRCKQRRRADVLYSCINGSSFFTLSIRMTFFIPVY